MFRFLWTRHSQLSTLTATISVSPQQQHPYENTEVNKHSGSIHLQISKEYRVFIKYCVFFSRILESSPPLPRQHSAAIGCTKNYQPIGVTVHSHCVETFEGLLQRFSRGRGCCSELSKNTIFPEHPVLCSVSRTFYSLTASPPASVEGNKIRVHLPPEILPF